MPERMIKGPVSGTQRLSAGVAMLVARLSRFFLRLFGRGATALPGKLALKISPDLLTLLVQQRLVFLVTGTNGKTTTVRVLCSILLSEGYDVITNPSGANLDTGLTTTLIGERKKLRRAPGKKLALVFEIDEAFFAKLAADLKPSFCVVTNFFRDQLDRFGELAHTRDLIMKGIMASDAKVILCADDSLCASLGQKIQHEVFYFGMGQEGMRPAARSTAGQESAFCTFCGTRYTYQAVSYGHLGRFSCSGCGYRRPEADLEFVVSQQLPQSLNLKLNWRHNQVDAALPIPGVHNAYNAAAAILAALAAGIPLERAVIALARVKAAFGRMERFSVGKKDVCIILVKNPVGIDRALEFVDMALDRGGLMFLLNANDPDGRDVSWIWDADFEEHVLDSPVGVSGVRCHDMALRLYYAGWDRDNIMVNQQALSLFDHLLEHCDEGKCLYILPNYTAMLDLRARLAERYQLKAFWQ